MSAASWRGAISLPYRTSNTCAANTVDAQAAYESVFSLWGAIGAGANFILHGAGWLEGGLRCSYEKTILDIDLLQMVAEFLTPLDLSDDALGVEAIRSVGPGGHFFGTPHTQERYKTAFYSPIISDWRNYETWAEAGSPDRHRARQPHLEGAPRDLRGALYGPGDPRGAQRLRRQAQGRRRRADGFLTLGSRSGSQLCSRCPSSCRTSPPQGGDWLMPHQRRTLPISHLWGRCPAGQRGAVNANRPRWATMKLREISAADAPPAPTYAQAIEVTGATRWLFVSGQIPVSKDGVVPDSFEDQARLAWANVIAQLRAGSA